MHYICEHTSSLSSNPSFEEARTIVYSRYEGNVTGKAVTDAMKMTIGLRSERNGLLGRVGSFETIFIIMLVLPPEVWVMSNSLG
jgi:hypothetical protein